MKRKTNFNLFKILSIVLILIFLSFLPSFIQKLIKVNTIKCLSQYGKCDEEIGNRLLVLGNYRETKKRIEQELKNNVQINNYLIQYKIPSTIEVQVNIKKPKSVIKNNDKLYLIDKNGIVIGLAKDSVLPAVNSNSIYKIGDQISTSDRFATNLLEKISFIYTVSSTIVLDKEVQILLGNGYLVRFNIDGDIDLLVGSLRLIISRLNDESNATRMKEIDLRFKNPVLR